ncbi:hypothetical protein KSP39_PZI002384 [Platanthera zijinensis]|uniref:Uncharacterized protein n=1 Tax=Platanthera zijinensis TaxID=2320716 RepID=A0AAP0BX02_9ASPA
MKSSSSSFSKFSIALLVVVSCNLLLLLINNNASHRQSKTFWPALELINFIASRVFSIVMAYLSFMVYHGIPPSLENLHRKLQKSWKQTTITMMYIELLNNAFASLESLARSAKGAASDIAVIAGLIFLISWLGRFPFMYYDAVYKISLIVSVAEEGCNEEKALEKANELVKEREVVIFFLLVLTVIIELAVTKMCRFGSAISLVKLLTMFFTYLAYTSFYYGSKKKSCHKGEKIL